MISTATIQRPPSARAWCRLLDGGSLTIDALDRMLLTTDGTVTTLLEAGTGEPIATELLRTAEPAPGAALDGDEWWHPPVDLVDAAPYEDLLVRQVLLGGAETGVAYLAAEAVVVPQRLPQAVSGALRRAGASLGRVLAASGLTTTRRIRDIAAVNAPLVAARLGVLPDTTLARRCYTIDADDRPVAAVTEWLVPGRLAARLSSPVGSRARRLEHLVDL